MAKITIQDLATEYGIEAKVIRALLRKNGFTAPAVEAQEGFGPKSKYEWDEDSADLDKIDEILNAHLNKAEAEEAEVPTEKATKVSKKVKETEVEEPKKSRKSRK